MNQLFSGFHLTKDRQQTLHLLMSHQEVGLATQVHQVTLVPIKFKFNNRCSRVRKGMMTVVMPPRRLSLGLYTDPKR